MRTRTEIELLNLRQRYLEYLAYLRALPVIPLPEYKRIYVRFQACKIALQNYRYNYKYRDIA